MPSFNKSASYPLPRINDGPDMARYGQIWLDGLLPRLDTVPLCCLFKSSAFGSLPTLFTPDTPVTRVTLVTRLHCYRLHRFSVSAHHPISISAYQRSSVSTFQCTSVQAYQRISILRCRLATYHSLSRTAYQRRTTSDTHCHNSPFFPEFVAALAFVANGRVWLQNAKKKAGKVPQTENQKNR